MTCSRVLLGAPKMNRRCIIWWLLSSIWRSGICKCYFGGTFGGKSWNFGLDDKFSFGELRFLVVNRVFFFWSFLFQNIKLLGSRLKRAKRSSTSSPQSTVNSKLGRKVRVKGGIRLIILICWSLAKRCFKIYFKYKWIDLRNIINSYFCKKVVEFKSVFL